MKPSAAGNDGHQGVGYADRNTWKWKDVPEKMRTGRWSQTVWQVDDSPRYGGWGQFEMQGGVSRWRSNWTWRSLARRDAVRCQQYQGRHDRHGKSRNRSA